MYLLSLLKKQLKTLIFKLIKYLSKKVSYPSGITQIKRSLSEKFYNDFNGVVQYGPLKGLKILRDRWWGDETACILFGLYEKEVLNSIVNASNTHGNFINLGAADGYYGVGLVAKNFFKKSYCYEISEKGQKSIKENSVLNGVLENLIIRGEAKKDFFKDFEDDELDNVVMLVDIEGGEYNLFDVNVFQKFKKATIYIEIHDFLVENGESKHQKLESDARNFFNLEYLTTKDRDLSEFKELSYLSDSHRWLIVSESRERLQKWLKLTPK